MKVNVKLGDTSSYTRTVSESDVYIYAGITADVNKLSLNKDFCEKNNTTQRVQNSYILGLISASLGAEMPGFGTIYLGQEIEYLNPAYIGDTLTIKCEVDELLDKKKFIIANIKTTCVNQKNEIIAEGKATAIPPMVRQ